MQKPIQKPILLNAIVMVLFFISSIAGAESVFDSGKSPEQIAAEILSGANDRFQREQMEKNNIVMYATNWCGYCRQARNYFRASGIHYTEHDIEADSDAKRKFDLLGGTGVPLIMVGGHRMQGFNKARFDKLYSQLNH